MKPRAACIYVDSARRYVEPAEEKKGVDRNWLSLREGHRHRKASHIQCMRTFTCCVRAAFAVHPQELDAPWGTLHSSVAFVPTRNLHLRNVRLTYSRKLGKDLGKDINILTIL
jgi:hypothetical protein